MQRTIGSLVLISLVGCNEPAALTEAEFANLQELVFEPEMLPEDPTNAWADDEAAAELGQKFFFDHRFSGPLVQTSDLGAAGELGKVACVSCHDPAQGGSDHRSGGPTSHGAGWTRRNAPTVVNAALVQKMPWMFWDGRADSLWAQALAPSETEVEHNASRLYIAHVMFDTYRADYEAVFGPMPDLSSGRFPPKAGLCDAASCLGKPGDAIWTAMSPEDQLAVSRLFSNFGKAIAAYERKLITPNSPFDEYMRGDESALSDAQIRGARLFVGRASCNECHRGAALADNEFHNLGVPQSADIEHSLSSVDEGRALGISEVLSDEFNASGVFSDDPDASAHLDDLEERPEDLSAFKTPTLRNVALTAPYMHNGAFATLWDVLDFYAFGGSNDDGPGIHDPSIQPLTLSDDDIHDLVEFLHSLTGSLPAELTTPPELP